MARKWSVFFSALFSFLKGSTLRRIGYGVLVVMMAIWPILSQSVVVQAQTPAALVEQGKRAYDRGRFPIALAQWQQAEAAYRAAQQPIGVVGSQLNQSQTLIAMGRYRRACQLLSGVVQVSADVCTVAVPVNFGILTTKLPLTLQIAALNNLGEVLRLVGNLEAAQVVLTPALKLAKSISPAAQVPVLLSIANNLRDLGDRERDRTEQLSLPSKSAVICPNQPLPSSTAANYYQRSIACYRLADNLPAHLNQLALQGEITEWLVQHDQKPTTNSWQQQFNSSQLIARIQQQLTALPVNYDSVAKRVNFAHSLGLSSAAQLPMARQLLAIAMRQAQTLENKVVLANALGTGGWLAEKSRQWSVAMLLTEQAITLAKADPTNDTLYQWEWQLGRILQRKDKSDLLRSQAAYQRAIIALEKNRDNLRVINPDAQFALRDRVQPLYRELVDLSLRRPQPDLAQVVAQVDALKLVDLENFLQCQLENSRTVNEFAEDSGAAVFYPIVLADRLEVIVRLPGNNFQRFTTPVSAQQLESTVQKLRKNLTQPQYGWNATPAGQLYDWLIQPARQYLNSPIKNLVFVMDGMLQDLPVAVLFDRQQQQYLIDQYPVAVTPGLKILGAKSVESNRGNILIGGLTTNALENAQRSNNSAKKSTTYQPLSYAATEIQAIKSLFPRSTELVGRNFTSDNLRRQLATNDYSIIHLATHGVFSADARQTFIVTAGGQSINLPDFQTMLKQRRSGSIDLLVLSACETATGDRRSSLGLAGMALRSGAASTLASLWSVDDRATAELMQKFYGALINQGLSKAAALRVAQQKVRSDYAHPYYWASFVLVGNWL